MASLSPYNITLGATDYPVKYSALLSYLEPYLTNLENFSFPGSGNVTLAGTFSATKLIPTGGTATGNGMYLPAANTLAWSNNGAETMRLDSSGNLAVSTTSTSNGKFTVAGVTGSANNTATFSNGTDFQSIDILCGRALTNGTSGGVASSLVMTLRSSGASAGDLAFATGNNERARITSGGDLLVGTTNASVGTAVGFRVVDSGGRLECGSANTANTNIGLSMYSTGAAAYRFYVGWGGTIYATSTTITAISDQRLKENVQDLDVGLDKIMALKPRKFDWKPGKGKNIKGDRGWIAQEFEQVFPDMVDQWIDPAPEGEEPYKAVNADLIPVLVKAIQEQQAIINDLRARVAALEQT